MPAFLVAHPHRGRDGTRRTPGEVVTIDLDEANTRVRDGFGRILPPDEAAAVREAAALRDRADNDDQADGEKTPAPPKMSSPKSAWVEYLTGQGHDPAELEGLARGQLIERARA